MRKLFILRGIPASGKSTWVKENSLEDYTVSSDAVRLLYSSPFLTPSGSSYITPVNDSRVWDTLKDILETRMKNGELTVVDATNTTKREMNRYKDLARPYGYDMICVDFSDVSKEEAKRRNAEREYPVPEEVIDSMAENIKGKIPSGIKVIKPEDFSKELIYPEDLSSYDRVHVLGDIHGCYTALMTYLEGGIKDSDFYVFCGDYTDRGIENRETLEFLMSAAKRDNVVLLEGNHEKWTKLWSRDRDTGLSKTFTEKTAPSLEGLSRKEVKVFTKRLKDCFYFTYGKDTFFVCHGGVSSLKENPAFISSRQLINGTGDYPDVSETERSFEKNCPGIIQIHGHRNDDREDIHPFESSYNLEGRVEKGGFLRSVEIDSEGIHTTQTKNPVYELSVKDLVADLREDPDIKEKVFDTCSSFNFTRKAFSEKRWNDRTITARGLYVDKKGKNIVCRGYDKFFEAGERPETSESSLKDTLVFPVKAYVKENGFLGMAGYIPGEGLLLTTKSDPYGDAAYLFRRDFSELVSSEDARRIETYLSCHPETFLFECVDPENDPHIIDYDRKHLYLLDIAKNTVSFQKKPYEEVLEKASAFHLEAKSEYRTFETFEELSAWYEDMSKNDVLIDGKHVEGFVLEDASGFMVKAKTPYYKEWKHMRSLVSRADGVSPDSLTEKERDFLTFVSVTESGEKNICELRSLYENRDEETYSLQKELKALKESFEETSDPLQQAIDIAVLEQRIENRKNGIKEKEREPEEEKF